MKFSFGETDEDDSNIFVSDGSSSNDMLTDSDDLLNQLSCDFGFSDFMEQDDNSILTDSSYEPDSGHLYPQLFAADENAILDELLGDGMQSSASSTSSSCSVKIEPYSPPQSRIGNSSLTGNSFPPSPSGSESDNFASHFSPEVIFNVDNTASQFTTPRRSVDTDKMLDITTPPVSPLNVTICPQQMTLANDATPLKLTFSPSSMITSTSCVTFASTNKTIVTSPNVIKISGFQCVTLPQTAVTVQSSPITTASLVNVKVPIPKISKPAAVPLMKSAPLILTSQQLAELTQSGVLKMSTTLAASTTSLSTATNRILTAQHQMAPIVIKTEPNCSPLSSGLPTVQSIPRYAVQMTPMMRPSKDNDMKCQKRQQRMIKNRESACLSRRKKKEYVTNLEDQLKQLENENSVLRHENNQLKSRLTELESEKKLWTDGLLNNPNVRKGTALFALLLVVSLNLGPLSGLYMNPQNQVPLRKHTVGLSPNFKTESQHIGRSLLWTETETENVVPSNTTMCPMYFNQTESIRLDNQLRGWFKLDPNVANSTLIPDFGNEIRAEPRQPIRRKHLRDGRKSIRPTAVDHYVKPDVRKSGSIYHMLISDRDSTNPKVGKYSQQGELTLFDTSTERFTLESFFEAINRREDTFYVVSFSGDHLLLPATSRNESVRPRMSLFLPSINVPVNDSMKPPANHVAMMQIDCEVINTSLVHISEDAIPVHLNVRMKSEAGSATKAASNSTLERNDSRKPFETFGNYQANVTGKQKNLFNNFEKSNNITRFKRGSLDSDNLVDFETAGDYSEELFSKSNFKQNRQWAGPSNKKPSKLSRRIKRTPHE